MGRIVIYRDVTPVDGEDLAPAIVQGVEANGKVRLFVIGRFTAGMRYGVAEGKEPGTWRWPERV